MLGSSVGFDESCPQFSSLNVVGSTISAGIFEFIVGSMVGNVGGAVGVDMGGCVKTAEFMNVPFRCSQLPHVSAMKQTGATELSWSLVRSHA